MFQRELDNGYTIRAMAGEEFTPLWQAHAKAVFDDVLPMFRYRETLPAAELDKVNALRAPVAAAYRLNLGLFRDDDFVGWSWGYQESGETFYMCNSAVLPAHRGQGLYQALIAAVIEETTAQGFQKLYSRHVATNNAVIVPKLKAGFVITGVELSDIFGTLVHLSYFPNALRRKMLDFRAGFVRPDAVIREQLGF